MEEPMMNLTSDQRRYLLIGQCALPFAFNFVFNGGLGLLMFRGVDPVPTWGVESSAAPDLIGTCFFLPAITCLIVTPIVRRHVRSGTVERVASELPRWLQLFRRSLPARALLFGLVTIASVGGILAAGLLAAGPEQLGLTPFLWLKATFSGALGGAVTPVIGVVALAESEELAPAA
jgi:hypothetical protein